VFTPVLAKHTKSFNLIDTLSVGGIETHTQRLGNIVLGVFTPVLAKHSKSFIDVVGVLLR
jgi:hypothetical protein